MISKWNSNKYGLKNAGNSTYNPDMWGISAVNSRTWNGSSGWYIPSRDEWAAFAGQLNITTSNYRSKGLSTWYWSSSQISRDSASYAYFDYDYFHGYGVNGYSYVRLGTTY